MDWKFVIAEHADKIPYFLAMRRSSDGNILPGVKLNTAKILESLAIAGITAVIVMYGMQAKLDAQMSDLKYQIAQDRSDRISRENRIEDKLDLHIRDTTGKHP